MNPLRFLVRPAEQSDVPAIRALLFETWHAAYDDIFGRAAVDFKCEVHFSEVLLRHYVRQSPRDWFSLAFAPDGALAGLIFVRMTVLGGAAVNLLYVRPAYQGRGLGAALLDKVCIVFPWTRRISLDVLVPNERGVAFYEKCGFVRGRVSKLVRESVPVLTMHRVIATEIRWHQAMRAFFTQDWVEDRFEVVA